MRAHTGFTQLELVVVLVLVGIMAVAFVPRMADSGFEERRLRDRAISALRFAQKSAIAARLHTCVIFGDSTHLAVHRDTNSSTSDCSSASPMLTGPDGNPLTVAAAGGTSFSAYSAVLFDAQGRPLGGKATISVANLPAALSITVEQETGYVH